MLKEYKIGEVYYSDCGEKLEITKIEGTTIEAKVNDSKYHITGKTDKFHLLLQKKDQM